MEEYVYQHHFHPNQERERKANNDSVPIAPQCRFIKVRLPCFNNHFSSELPRAAKITSLKKVPGDIVTIGDTILEAETLDSGEMLKVQAWENGIFVDTVFPDAGYFCKEKDELAIIKQEI